MTVKQLKKIISKLDDNQKIRVAVPNFAVESLDTLALPSNILEGIYPMGTSAALVLPDNDYILLADE